jgi:Metallo-peptidase family M12B Reprolysin-like/FlgD Ig-like domain/HYR domain
MHSTRVLSWSLFTLCTLIALGSSAEAAAPYWSDVPSIARDVDALPSSYRSVAIDVGRARNILNAAPGRLADADRGLELELPTPDGGVLAIRVVRADVLSPEWQARRPDLKTFRGVGAEDASIHVRLGFSQDDFHAVVRNPTGSWSIMQREGLERGQWVVAYDRDFPGARFNCGVDDSGHFRSDLTPRSRLKALGESLVTYRIAMTGTGEYTQFHGSVPIAESDLTTLVNVINSVYEIELGVTLQIVDLNVYSDPATDPFSDGTVLDGNTLSQNTNALNSKLGIAGYDIGHVISQSPGIGPHGLAYVGVQCTSWGQGGGGSFGTIPRAGSLSDVVLHELGHQLGAVHSFNSETAGCNGNRSGSWAYEIGSGVTIMSYAGLCGGDNVTGAQIDVFNAGALQQISSEINGSPSCGSRTNLGNNAPVVDAGPAQTIPRDTAFELRGSATDVDGDALTFSWEQYDLGPSNSQIVQTSGPLFRNFAPTPDSVRSFPLYTAYRRSASTPWEFLPGVDRSMVFRLVTRDNVFGTGSTVWSSTTVTVTGAQFSVTSPNGGENLTTGNPANVTWDKGGTVDANVRILFSDDAGVTWTEAMASTPNDGSESVAVACVPTIEGRVRVEGTTNNWFDLSDNDFTVVADTDPPVMTCPDSITVTATGPDGIAKTDPALAGFFASVVALDSCDPNPSIQNFAPDIIPVGVNQVAFLATDSFGNLAVCTTEITVESQATAAPDAKGATALLKLVPNPFNPRTTVVFRLEREQQARLEVLDLRGRRVAVVAEGRMGSGLHEYSWDGQMDSGSAAASGVYFFRLSSEDGIETLRGALLK